MKASNKLYKSLSRQFICEAMLSLMEEKQYQDISVSEITKKAQIARRTFYFNYSGKDDVLKEYIDVLFLKYKERIDIKEVNNPKEEAYQYFDFWNEHIDFIKLLHKNGLFTLLLDKYKEVLIAKYPFETECNINGKLAKNENKYFNYFNAAGIWMLLNCWIENNQKESAQEMAEIYLKITGIFTAMQS